MWRNDVHRWGWIAQLLHWSVVGLLVAQVTLAWMASDLPLGLEKLVLLTRHKSIGLLILLLVALRILWRLASTTPAPAPAMPIWQRRLAATTQGIIYICLVALPMSGWVMSSARNFSVSFFGLYQLPDFVEPGETLYEASRNAHELLVWVLAVAVLLHVLGALKHHFIDRDDVLRRMLPFASRRQP
jgi:cytochrome b561